MGIRWRTCTPRTGAGLSALLVAASLVTPAANASARSSAIPDESAGRADRPAAGDASTADVIVRHAPGAAQEAKSAVIAHGGVITGTLDLIDSLTARVPAGVVGEIAATPGVVAVTPDSAVELLSTDPGGYDPAAAVGSLLNVTTMTGAREWWAAGHTGRGIDVALIDSGTVPVEGLSASGKVVSGPDLSFDSVISDVAHMDSFGHGTHMAGIIAGRDSSAAGSLASDRHSFLGMAPDARIIDVKVADTEGKVDVSQVIAAIDWVVQNRRANGMNIRVLNLSFGTDTRASYLWDPMSYAAEQAWRKGIVVVVSAGNAGLATGLLAPGLTDPAINPFVLAVGAADHNGTLDRADDRVAGFSSSGDGGWFTRNPDLVAPGRSIESLKSPGSMLDLTYPQASAGTRFMRGSGSSQAAAVVSGAAALIVSRFPAATPDQVKRLLTSTAVPLASAPAEAEGAGEIDLSRALRSPLPEARSSRQWFFGAAGTGSLEQSRGSSHVTFFGIPLSGDFDVFFSPFTGVLWVWDVRAGNAWRDLRWNYHRWLADDGRGGVLARSPLIDGTPWGAELWSGNRWSGNRWSGDGWHGNRWSGNRWSGDSW